MTTTFIRLAELLPLVCKSFLFVVELGENKLTVGKIYAGLLIAENWKAFKVSAKTSGVSVDSLRYYCGARLEAAWS